MKEIKELLNILASDDLEIDRETKAEILSIFSSLSEKAKDLEKEKERIKESALNTHLINRSGHLAEKALLEEEISSLEKQVEDLKCCGNCKFRYETYVHENLYEIKCQRNVEKKESCDYCQLWETDTCDRKIRER